MRLKTPRDNRDPGRKLSHLKLTAQRFSVLPQSFSIHLDESIIPITFSGPKLRSVHYKTLTLLTLSLSPHLRSLLNSQKVILLSDTNMADQQPRRAPSHAPTSRPKPAATGEEEAGAHLTLGEFDNVETLTLSEASLVIHALINRRRKDRKDRNETEVLSKTLDYLDAFARFRQKENVEAVERLLSAHQKLNKFERAQIGKCRRPHLSGRKR